MRFAHAHALPNKDGSVSVVGAVPITCLTLREPTVSDIMGGRIVETPEGRRGWTGRSFPTMDDARAAVLAGGGALCGCCWKGAEVAS